MVRALDHVVWPCSDLGAEARRFEALGFTVGRRNRHPWGTENHLIQVPGAFIELIGLAPEAEPVSPEADAFRFAGFLNGVTTSTDPSGMLVLGSADAVADAERFAGLGIGTRHRLDFARDAAAADGSTKRVAFSLAFAEAPSMPDIGFFVCQQHYPENFWNPAAQRHANGVIGISGVIFVADRPADHATFLGAFSDHSVAAGRDGGLLIPIGGSRLEVVTPDAFQDRFGATLSRRSRQAGFRPFLAAVCCATSQLEASSDQIAPARAVACRDGWAIEAVESGGITLVLEPSSHEGRSASTS
ncbi:VOC family protein [Lichenihabitans psoromatis]|uniref:VOC family protein n=1 Tax=Lichenihabitans psoromatis TaxID=2528642 RepID=UPI001036A53C|nr:VOC family protein [Lichenihabitans psoromatis]